MPLPRPLHHPLEALHLPSTGRDSKGLGLGLYAGLFILLSTCPPAHLFSCPHINTDAQLPVYIWWVSIQGPALAQWSPCLAQVLLIS